MDSDGANIVTLGSGFNNPRHIAVQPDGKILVADTGNGALKRMDANGANIVTFVTGLNIPSGVTVQSDGKIIIVDTNNNAIKRVDADGTNIETLGSGFSFPFRVEVQSDGKIVIADNGNGAIKRMDADGTNIEVIQNGFSSNHDLALEANGNILVAETGTNSIKRISLMTSLSNRVPVLVDFTLSTINYDVSENISVFPNPLKEVVFIKVNNLENTSLQVYDVSGRLVLSKKRMSSLNKLNVSNFEAGIYLFKIKYKEGEAIKKMIKN